MKLQTPALEPQYPTSVWADETCSLVAWDYGFERYERWSRAALHCPAAVLTECHEFDILNQHLTGTTPAVCLYLPERFDVEADTIAETMPTVARWTSSDGRLQSVVLAWRTETWSFIAFASPLRGSLDQQYGRGGAPFATVVSAGSRTAMSVFNINGGFYQQLAAPDEHLQGDYDNDGRMVVVLQPRSYRQGK